MTRDDWDWGCGKGFAEGFGFAFGPGGPFGWAGAGRRRGRRRHQVFESGDVKFVVLKLLREKPRHGYEVIKELEDRFGGWYSPSPGTVYPTLQLLEDQGLVRIEETDGKKVYHITPAGERFLDEHKSTLDEIFDRVREVVGEFAGGSMGELNEAFGRLARAAYRRALRSSDAAFKRRIAEILRKAAEEIETVEPGGGASQTATSP